MQTILTAALIALAALPVWAGPLVIRDLCPNVPVTIDGDGQTVERIEIRRACNLVLRDFIVEGRHGRWGALVSVERSEDIALTGLTVRSAPDMTGWTAEDWRERAAYVGVRFRWSKRVSLTDSTIRGVHFGVGSDSPGTRIERVAITMFAGDGIQITGSGSRIIDNRIEGCVSVNGNHPDAIQSWSFGDPVSDILIAGNTIIEAGADEDLRCHLQGIASFDGRPAGWVVVGNTVEVGSWHGISLYGADDAVIAGNTVIDARPDDEIVPRILLAPGKDGRPATGITEGNIAP